MENKLKFSFPFLGGIFLFWLMIFFISISQSMLSNYVNQRPNNWTLTLIWSGGWLIWFFLTPLIFYISQKFPIQRKNLQTGIFIHFLWAIGFGFLQFGLETLLGNWAYTIFGQKPNSPFWFVGLLTYKFHVSLFIYLFWMGIAHAWQYFQKYQTSELIASQLENQLQKAQLQTLKMQLQPHFLFNAHHAIIGLMLKQENEKAIEMLTRLSDLLRLTLERAEMSLIYLEKELEMVKLFLEIHQIRFPNRLKISWEIEEITQNAQIPNLILQPLVENAIKHGISLVSTAGNLRISSQKKDSFLIIEIQDDGLGCENLVFGFGLQNTQHRLEQIYGNEFQLSFEKPATGGFLVILEIPFII